MLLHTASLSETNGFQLTSKKAGDSPARTNNNQTHISSAWINKNMDQLRLEHLTRENKEVTTLYNMGIAIGASLSLQEVVMTLYKECGRLIDTKNFAIAIYNDHTDSLDFALVFDQGRRGLPFSLRLSASKGLVCDVFTNQTPRLAQDISSEDNSTELDHFWSDKKIRSWLGVPIFNPILASEKAQGIIAIWSYEPNAYTDHDLWLLSTIGTQTAISFRNARLFETGQQRAREMAAMNEVAYTLSSTLQLDEVLSRIMEQAESLLNVEDGSLLLTDPSTGDLVFQLALRNKPGETKPFRIPQGQGVIGEVAATGKPLMRVNINRYVRNILCAPIILCDQVIGVLEVRNKRGKVNQDDLALLSSIASYAAIAIENARLHEKILTERDRVIEAEEQARKELARDLHDGPTQLVSTMVMQLQFCQKALETDPSLLPKQFETMQEFGQKAVHQMRTMLFELRPLVLETEGLVPALQVFLERRQQEVENTSLSLNLKPCQSNRKISCQEDKVEAALFAIVQEAVNNALKHAEANNIAVYLKETPTAIYTMIVDDGHGFDVDKVMHGYEQQASLGMVNIQERTELIGGTLTIKSVPSQGTHITVYVPKAKTERMKNRGKTGLLSLPFN